MDGSGSVPEPLTTAEVGRINYECSEWRLKGVRYVGVVVIQWKCRMCGLRRYTTFGTSGTSGSGMEGADAGVPTRDVNDGVVGKGGGGSG